MDNGTLDNETAYELQLIDVDQSDNGEYYCSAHAKGNSNLGFNSPNHYVRGKITELLVGKQSAW